ncbi:ATP-binding cassette domain-containing protein [Plantactinospora sp. GCM10030261]|uniref:ATP-binding cassette domain-containing protein n=1 Tax=Plantactinospora sp. GCM10030261 TaxID=3273420 RepID=UPI0036179DC9
MNDDQWLGAFAAELHRRGIGPDVVRQIVAEAGAHLRDSGHHPATAFGRPDGYADRIVDSLRADARPRPTAAPAARSAPRTQPGPVRLAARGIRKRYGRREVLRGVDLTVRAGEIVAVVGANGCGKSTLLRICAGLMSPDDGEVTVSGRLAFCPQQGGTADFLLPDEHFILVGAGHGLDRQRSRRLGRAAAARLDWEVPRDVTARHLSGGTRQKLNLTMSTLGGPEVLLLDEPYQGFDRGAYLDLWEDLGRLRADGTAIVVVTHLLTELDRVDAVLDLTGVPAGVA